GVGGDEPDCDYQVEHVGGQGRAEAAEVGETGGEEPVEGVSEDVSREDDYPVGEDRHLPEYPPYADDVLEGDAGSDSHRQGPEVERVVDDEVRVVEGSVDERHAAH